MRNNLQRENSKSIKSYQRWNVLVSGGSVGAGNIMGLLQAQTSDKGIDYVVLCGQNKKLYEEMKKLNLDYIYPLPYIRSKHKMNELYNQAHAIITKPGGVTISEALQKRIPIFIHSALPGQEEINLQLLKDLHLVCEINDQEMLSDQVIRFLKNQTLIDQYHHSLQNYHNEKQAKNPTEIYNLMKHLLTSSIEQEKSYYES